mmetsp:Transcript_11301/g.35126  ORF Transcript_11301/g.35126 Transcript_11301/m.35126 type:complete len:672 (+) Transcript_11301:1323-3338(+)
MLASADAAASPSASAASPVPAAARLAMRRHRASASTGYASTSAMKRRVLSRNGSNAVPSSASLSLTDAGPTASSAASPSAADGGGAWIAEARSSKTDGGRIFRHTVMRATLLAAADGAARLSCRMRAASAALVMAGVAATVFRSSPTTQQPAAMARGWKLALAAWTCSTVLRATICSSDRRRCCAAVSGVVKAHRRRIAASSSGAYAARAAERARRAAGPALVTALSTRASTTRWWYWLIARWLPPKAALRSRRTRRVSMRASRRWITKLRSSAATVSVRTMSPLSTCAAAAVMPAASGSRSASLRAVRPRSSIAATAKRSTALASAACLAASARSRGGAGGSEITSRSCSSCRRMRRRHASVAAVASVAARFDLTGDDAAASAAPRPSGDPDDAAAGNGVSTLASAAEVSAAGNRAALAAPRRAVKHPRSHSTAISAVVSTSAARLCSRAICARHGQPARNAVDAVTSMPRVCVSVVRVVLRSRSFGATNSAACTPCSCVSATRRTGAPSSAPSVSTSAATAETVVCAAVVCVGRSLSRKPGGAYAWPASAVCATAARRGTKVCVAHSRRSSATTMRSDSACSRSASASRAALTCAATGKTSSCMSTRPTRRRRRVGLPITSASRKSSSSPAAVSRPSAAAVRILSICSSVGIAASSRRCRTLSTTLRPS